MFDFGLSGWRLRSLLRLILGCLLVVIVVLVVVLYFSWFGGFVWLVFLCACCCDCYLLLGGLWSIVCWCLSN